jgi:parvulin-like peptidyl-prolyl isomerase
VAVRNRRGPGLTRLRSLVALGITLCFAGSLGCAGIRPSPSVVRVGNASISKRTIDHWASVIARGAVVANVADPQWSAKRQALALLIYSHWLVGEAANVGLHPSRRQLEQAIEAQERALQNGRDEFRELLTASGETLADAEFEARARLAAEALSRRFAALARQQARAEVSAEAIERFYRAHAARYHLRERRYYDLREWIPTKAKAEAMRRWLGSGRRFAARASKEQPYRPTTYAGLPGQAVAYRAVFAAKVGVLTGPVPLHGKWALFVLRRIEPPRVQPLSEVRAGIERKLLVPAERRARAQAIEGFHQRWLSRTNCRPGFVVQKCRQYKGPAAAEQDPLSGF